MFGVPGQREPVLLIAALAPLMLKLAGELADGTILWFADEHAIEHHVVPRITEAAAAAGRPAPRIVAPFPVALCDEAEGRERAAKTFAAYTQIPTYQRILARGSEGTARPSSSSSATKRPSNDDCVASRQSASPTSSPRRSPWAPTAPSRCGAPAISWHVAPEITP